ncbi:MAG TPA: trigger factor [Pyrinomonadaceae bacterium]|nr:trigger factor [Pyrinomonadaceae bacterium]
MKTELVDVSPTRKEIKIEIESDAVRETYNRVSDTYARQVKVPGFRPGHAPRSVVRTRFKKEIRGDVLRELVPDAVSEAIQKYQLLMVGEPDVHLDETEETEPFGQQPIGVHVHLETLPNIELRDYKGLEATRRVRPVTEDDVERAIQHLRELSASLQPVEDRGAQQGDTVTVNFHGKFVDQPDEEDINVADVDVVLGGEAVQPEFTENLLGVREDDERRFRVVYPEDFSSKGLAGKTVDYEATVTAVRLKELPELDDDWARSLSEDFDSVATLREKIKEDLENQAASESDHHVRSELMKKLLETHNFEVPLSLINHQTNQRVEAVVRDMIGKGIDPRSQELNWEGAREELQTQAELDVRGSLLLERIADEEKITVSDDEIENEIVAIANASRKPIEQVRAVLTKNGGERSIANRLRNRKALDLLIANARVTDEEWREDERGENVEEATP